MGGKGKSFYEKYTIPGMIKSAYEKPKQKAEAQAAEVQSQLDAEKTASAAAKAKYDEDMAQQEAVRKKMASLGRLQAGYTFSDSQAATGATKVFS